MDVLRHAVAALALGAALPLPSPSPDAVAPFRVVALARDGERLAIAGGRVLRLAPDCACASGPLAGRALLIALDDDGRVVAARRAARGERGRQPEELPARALVVAPAAAAEAGGERVVVEIDVEVPSRTPAGSDVYLSTERSAWNPSEVRMDRVDPRRFRARLELPRGSRLAFRVTRGNAATAERDAARAVPPAHVVVAAPGARETIAVAAWADID